MSFDLGPEAPAAQRGLHVGKGQGHGDDTYGIASLSTVRCDNGSHRGNSVLSNRVLFESHIGARERIAPIGRGCRPNCEGGWPHGGLGVKYGRFGRHGGARGAYCH
jgi:hypothetical protein